MSDLADQLIALERSMHAESIRTGPAAGDLLADDFTEFGASGRTFDKAGLLAALRTETYRPIEAYDFKVQFWADDVAMIHYRSRRDGQEALRTSVWNRRDDRWRMVFHQGSPVRPSRG